MKKHQKNVKVKSGDHHIANKILKSDPFCERFDSWNLKLYRRQARETLSRCLSSHLANNYSFQFAFYYSSKRYFRAFQNLNMFEKLCFPSKITSSDKARDELMDELKVMNFLFNIDFKGFLTLLSRKPSVASKSIFLQKEIQKKLSSSFPRTSQINCFSTSFKKSLCWRLPTWKLWRRYLHIADSNSVCFEVPLKNNFDWKLRGDFSSVNDPVFSFLNCNWFHIFLTP